MCACDFVTDLNELHQQLRQNIAKAQCWYQVSTDSQWILAPEFKIGSQVYVKVQFFHTTWPSKKLSNKFLGPYEILALPGTHSITLWLPNSVCTVHLVFHISMLEPATPTPIPDCVQPLPPPIIVNNELEFEIYEILDSKIDNQQQAWKLVYLVC